MMKRIVLIAILTISANIIYGQSFLKQAQSLLEETTQAGFSEEEAGKAIKEALNKGVVKGVEMVSKENGYFGDLEIKIPFPEEAKTIETKLKAMGMQKKVDEVVLSINRAAEDAAQEAKDIFIAAIKEMTLSDAINIVNGEEDAATQYLQKHTTADLVAKFKPVIETSLEKVDATKYWSDVINTYNKLPFVKKMNPDLTQYVTEKAIEGLFVKIAIEEKEIRKDPAARTSELLKKVFGS